MLAGAVEELVAQGRVVARAQAGLLELVLQVFDSAGDPRFGGDEVAFALTWTRAATDGQQNLARQLIHHLPEVFAALHAGDIDLPKARVFADTLQALDPQVASRVAGQVLPVAPRKTTAQLRAMLHRRALAADPQHARKRRAEGVRERRVVVEPAADGTATLTAFGLPPERAQAAFERVTAIAKARKLSGAAATIDQLRADALLDLLDGTHIDVTPGPRAGVIELLVGLETLAGLDDNPATLHGFGPVAADIARQYTAANHGAQWRFSIIDHDGQLLFHHHTHTRPTPPHTPTPPTQTEPTPNPPTPPPPRTPTQAAQTQPPQHPPTQTQPPQGPPPHQGQPMQHAPTRGQPTPTPPPQGQPVPSQPPPSQPVQGQPTQGQPMPGQPMPGQPTWGLPVPCPPPQDPHARFPNAAMTAWIRARDRTCRAPGCRIPARNCHLDHTTDYAKGGPTTHDDLGPACAHHHAMKHQGGWQLYQTRPGHFIWISPANRIYHVGPEPP